jgi:hypothetical protein
VTISQEEVDALKERVAQLEANARTRMRNRYDVAEYLIELFESTEALDDKLNNSEVLEYTEDATGPMGGTSCKVWFVLHGPKGGRKYIVANIYDDDKIQREGRRIYEASKQPPVQFVTNYGD